MSAAEMLLKRLVEQAGGGAETGYVLVIDGEGLEDLPPQVPTPQATYGVHRARTELGLRHLLWQARGAPIIAVLPEELARRIRQAPDLLRRARNQRVHSLQVTDVLEVALGVRVVGAEPPCLQQLALDHVDRLSEEMRRRTLPTVVDRRLLTELLKARSPCPRPPDSGKPHRGRPTPARRSTVEGARSEEAERPAARSTPGLAARAWAACVGRWRDWGRGRCGWRWCVGGDGRIHSSGRLAPPPTMSWCALERSAAENKRLQGRGER